MKIPVYWDDEHHEANIILMNNLSNELSKHLVFYNFEPLSSYEEDEISIDLNGGKATKQLRGYLHEFYRNDDEAKPDLKKQQSPSFVQLSDQRGKTIWYGAYGFAKSKTVKSVWKAMAIPFFYDSNDKDQSRKAQNAIEALEREVEDKVTLWKFVPKAEVETICPKSSTMQKQGTILEVYATESEDIAKRTETSFNAFSSARFRKEPDYQFGMKDFEDVGAKQFVAEVIEKPQTEQAPLVQNNIEEANLRNLERVLGFISRVQICPCARRKEQSKKN